MKKRTVIISIVFFAVLFSLSAAAFSPVTGDINADGNITSADARLALRAAVGLEILTNEQCLSADMNFDGEITAADARLILRRAVGLDVFPEEHEFSEWIITENATCISSGIRIKICSACGYKYTELIPPYGHSPGPSATCTKPQICTRCNNILMFPLEHTPGADAGCVSPQVCTVCNDILTPARGHRSSSRATCTNAEICKICSVVISPATGHTSSGEADCTAPEICTVCSAVLSPAKGHTPGSPATCTDACKCTVCGISLYPPAGHTSGGAASCTSPEICTICGKILSAATGHTGTSPATCTEPEICAACGIIITPAFGHVSDNSRSCETPERCTVCGSVLSQPAGHISGGKATCTCAETCTVCGKVIAPAAGHIPATPPSCTQNQLCSVCGIILTPAGHTDENSDFICDRCGMNSQAQKVNELFNALINGKNDSAFYTFSDYSKYSSTVSSDFSGCSYTESLMLGALLNSVTEKTFGRPAGYSSVQADNFPVYGNSGVSALTFSDIDSVAAEHQHILSFADTLPEKFSVYSSDGEILSSHDISFITDVTLPDTFEVNIKLKEIRSAAQQDDDTLTQTEMTADIDIDEMMSALPVVTSLSGTDENITIISSLSDVTLNVGISLWLSETDSSPVASRYSITLTKQVNVDIRSGNTAIGTALSEVTEYKNIYFFFGKYFPAT